VPPPHARLLSFTRFDAPAGASVQSIELRAAPAHGELAVYGLAVLDATGQAHQLFGRHNAKYTPVYRDDRIVVLENSAAFSRAFVVPGARIASAGSPLDEMMHQPFDPTAEVILARDEVPPDGVPGVGSDAPPSAYAQPGSARVEEYTPNRVRLTASTPRDAVLVLSDTVYPGWRAFVDGREAPVLRGDMLFRVVALPAGQHQVEFRFEPQSVQLGLLVTLASLLLVSGLVIALGRGR
jgi:Bacterial membrane protein YfhO